MPKPPLPVAETRLSRGSEAKKINLSHFAFYRGWLEGLDLGDLGDRYLPTGRDLPEAKKTLRWMQDELVAAAKRSKPYLARVLRLTPAQLQNLTAAPSPAGLPEHLPTLEDFREQVDPDGDFYTEAQLIELFQENYRDRAPAAATRKAERNARLIKKLREVLTWLEGWIAVSPQKEDPVESWLAEVLADRLRAHKLHTLGDLVAFIQRYGSAWHRRVVKIGPVAATRLERWLEENHLWSRAQLPSPSHAPALVMDIVPLERLLVPEDLAGTHGTNRLHEYRIDAKDDFSAVNAWLAAQPYVVNTQRAYRSQAERFLLWMIFEREKPLSSANIDDCIAYREFLGSLEEGALWFWRTPRERWVGNRAIPRTSPDWRPFAGPLVPKSQKHAISILTSMFAWLVKRRYLEYNPWDGVSVNYTTTVKIRVDHSLTRRQWEHCLQVLEELPDDEKSHRVRTLVRFAYSTGVRLSELTSIKTASPPRPGTVPTGLILRPDEDGVYRWGVDVIGKGNKHRSLEVSSAVIEVLQAYGVTMGRPPLLEDWPANTPVFMTLGGGGWRVKKSRPDERQPLSESQVYRILKEFFAWAASKCDSRADREHLAQASTHWLRHTYASHTLQTEEGELTLVQETLGHASAATTAIYTHTSRRQRRAAADALVALSERAKNPR